MYRENSLPPSVAAAAMPLFSEHLDVNLTTLEQPPDFLEPFGPPSTPHLTLHEFRKLQQSPFTTSSPDLDYKRVRRKASQADLSYHLLVAATGDLPVAGVPPLFSAPPAGFLPSLLLEPFPTTPQQRPAASSPSLSSTGTTLQSTPTQTPAPVSSSCLEQRRLWSDQWLQDPIHVKRKFPNFKPAKRLPQRDGGDGGGWCVYAAIIGDNIEYPSTSRTQEVSTSEGEDGSGENNFVADTQAAICRAPAKQNRSVRFAGLGADTGGSASEQTGSSEEKASDAESTFRLSKFKFPAPPGSNWAGTFGKLPPGKWLQVADINNAAGHLNQPTPPTSPATLHYRGASFDVVNPHASLLLGSHEIETPAEIDGLLDDYFDPKPDMQYDNITGEMSESSSSLPNANEGSRRGRTLFADPESARQTIMRIRRAPSGRSGTPVTYNESPLAGRGVPLLPDQSEIDMQRLDEGRMLDSMDRPPKFQTSTRPQRADRGSSLYPQSLRSDPFDLHVSESEDEPHNNIDTLVAAGRSQQRTAGEVPTNAGEEFAVYDESADAEATTRTQDHDTTIGNIVEHYDYSSVFQYQNDDDEEITTVTPNASSSIERGRGTGKEHARPDGRATATTSHLANPFRDPLSTNHQRTSRLASPPILPAPSPPQATYCPHPCRARPAEHAAGDSDLPTSDQTYGATGELLQLTPANGATYGAVYSHPTGGSPIGYEYVEAPDKNQENAPPSTTAQPTVATPGIPALWSDVDLTSRNRASLSQRGLSGQFMARYSSQHAPDDEAWEDTQYSESHPDLVHLAGRHSEESVADFSDYDAESEHAILFSQGQPSMQMISNMDGNESNIRFGNKEHRVLMTTSADIPQDHIFDRAVKILKQKMLEERIADGMLPGCGKVKVADRERQRRDLVWLEELRQRQPSIIKRASDRVLQILQQSRPLGRGYYKAQNSWENVQDRGMRAHSVSSSQRGLLRDTQSPYSDRGLEYSPTANTFRTIKQPDVPPVPIVPSSATSCYSPLDRMPTAMTPRGRATVTPSSQRTGDAAGYELNELGRSQRSRAAMSSQTGLRSLVLGEGRDSTLTLPLNRPLTDIELEQRERNWTMGPGPGPRCSGRRLGLDLPVNTVTEPTLLSVEEARHPQMVQKQKEISKYYFWACAWLPPLALAYGLGYFDERVSKATGGCMKGMLELDKKEALWAAVPLGLIGYAAIGLFIALLFEIAHL